MRTGSKGRAVRAFTLIELLVVIAIIAILAAILFPVFGTVREQVRQSSAMSNMHAVYLGARLFYEDEGRYPSSLFGYAETSLNTNPSAPGYDPNGPFARPLLSTDSASSVTPMSQATGNFQTTTSINKGYLFHEQVKDYTSFLDPDNLVGNQQNGQQQVTTVIYPDTLPTLKDGTSLAGSTVVWTKSQAASGGVCATNGDSDLPANASFVGQPKYYYKMDSMDIGPRIDPITGQAVKNNGDFVYELHYSPDWTRELYDPQNGCDIDKGGNPIVTQLKYKNPPTDRTILTYVTDHAATTGSPNILILLMSGTARAISYKHAYDPNYALPLYYH